MGDDRPPRQGDAGEPPKRKRLTDAERGAVLGRLVRCRGKLSAADARLFEEVFPEIFRAHHPEVLRQILMRRVPLAEAEDLLQEVFLTLLDHVPEHGFPDNLAAFLRTLTWNKLLNHLRGAKRDPQSIGLPSSGSEPPRTDPDVERILGRKEAAARVLALLSDEHREVIELVLISGYAHQEAAELLGLPLDTLRSRLMAAKDRLRTVAKQVFPESQRPSV